MQDLHDQINDYESQLKKGMELQEIMKLTNAIVKNYQNKKFTQDEAIRQLVGLGMSSAQADKILEPDFMGRKGFPQYKLTNNNANNKRLKDRIEQIKSKLQGAKAVKNSGQAEEYVFDGGTIEVNYEIDRVQILFPGGRVERELFRKLRSNGYVYSPTNQAFQRKITPQAIRNAIHLFDAKKVDSKILEKGIEVENEQEDTIEKIASGEISFEQAPEEIAKDHLTEDTKYYDKLEQVEDKKNPISEQPKKAEPFFTETGTDGYDSRIHKSKKENGQYVLRDEIVLANIYSDFTDKLHELDLWLPFEFPKGETRYYRKFIFTPELQKKGVFREITDQGIKEELLYLPKGNVSATISVGSETEANRVSALWMKLNPNELNPRDSWYITRSIGHTGVERAVLSLVKNGNDQNFRKDFESVKSNINYSTQDKFLTGLKKYTDEYNEKIASIQADLDKWVKTGGPHLKNTETYKEKTNDIEALKILLNHISVLNAIVEENWDNADKLEQVEDKKNPISEQPQKAEPFFTETHLAPNTPEEFDEVIFKNIADKVPDRWIGNVIKQRVVMAVIHSELHGQESEKMAEVKRLFKAFYEREKANPEYSGATELKNDLTKPWVTGQTETKERMATIKTDREISKEAFYFKIIVAVTPKIEPHWIGKQLHEVSLRNLIWNEIQKNTTYNITTHQEKQEATNEIYDQLFNGAREKEYSYDKPRAEEYAKVLNMNSDLFSTKFGIKKFNIDDYLRARFSFKNDDQAEIDLTLNLIQSELFSTMKTDTWNRVQDIQYWLRNAVQYLNDKPELILANLQTSNREFTSHPKGYIKNAKSIQSTETKYKVGDILVSKTNIEKPNKFSVFYQTGEQIKVEEVVELNFDEPHYIVSNIDYYGSNIKEEKNTLPENYISENFIPKEQYEKKTETPSTKIINSLYPQTQEQKNIEFLKKFKTIEEIENFAKTLAHDNYGVLVDRELDLSMREKIIQLEKEENKKMETQTKKVTSFNPMEQQARIDADQFLAKPYLKGTYDNQYELNKGIEAFLTAKGNNPMEYLVEEKSFIKKYSGYGGLSKFGTAGKGAFFEYYTPKPVIRKMWALAYKYGYKGGSVLESSVGTGEFLALAPKDASITAYEINPFSADICRILYPQAKVYTEPFEKNFIENNFTIKDRVTPLYDLCIGNCPYGSFEIVQSRYLSGMGELKHVQAKNYAEYFLRRSMDLLKPGGLLVLIIGADVVNGGKLFLDSDISPVKEYLAEHSDLLDAYRLPDSVFERTQVTTEIVVLQKK